MILLDTSIWIELLNGKLQVSEDDLLRFVTCGPVVQEVLQGIRRGPSADAFREAFLALPCVGDPLPLTMFQTAAEIFSLGRRKGRTVRSSVDCLIAAVAIENRLQVWHRDRDFEILAEFTALETLTAFPSN